MTSSTPLSPRQEALNSILQVRQATTDATIDPNTWDKIVTTAWDNRSHSGDRREIQRSIREILLEVARNKGGFDATA